MSNDREQADRIEELALACLEGLEQQGEAAVDRVCSEHPELAGRVCGLLHQLESVGLLGSAAAEPPRDLGDFRLLCKLGEGGMGVVWLAEQLKLRRRVALKLLRPGLQLHARLRERFRREVQALSKLDHPNICTVYEAGEIEGAPYLAMRYVGGQSLAQVLEERRRERFASGTTTRATPSRELLELVRLVEKVAVALHAAHEAGVVHRDVKPGNVLIDAGGEPVLVDFGLAHDDDPALSVLTVSGEPLGTPAYMAPEQVSGTGPIDRRTDVYALGAMLYECATLQTPFTGPSRDSLYSSILHDPVPDPRKSNRSVGRELRAVLEKALDKDRRRRFATALELAEELGRIRRHEPVRTRPVGPVLRTVRWCQRNRAATVVLAVVSVALVVSVLFLQRSVAAEEGFRALALIAAAEGVEQENPELAFKLCREALFVQDDPAQVDPLVVAKVQETMFRLRKYEEIRRVEGRLEWVQFSPDPDGRFLFVSGARQPPSLHRGDNGSSLFEFQHVMPLQKPAVAFSGTGDLLAIGDDAGLVHLYDLSSGMPARIASFGPGSETIVARAAWSPDARQLVLGHGNGAASVWTRNGTHVGDLAPVDATIGKAGDPWWGVAFLPDARVVAAGAIWSTSLDDPIPLEHQGVVESGISRIECTATRILTQRTERPGATLWDHQGQVHYMSPLTERQEDFVLQASFAPDGARFAVSFGDGRLELRDAQDGELLDVFRDNMGGTIIWFAFSRDGTKIALAHFGGLLQVWQISASMSSRVSGHLGQAFSVDFAPKGDRLVSASWDGTARMWELEEPLPGVRQVFAEGAPDVRKVRDGVVVSRGRGEVLLCDLDGEVLRTSRVEPGWCSLGVAPGGTKVVICSIGGTVWTWDLDAATPEEPELVADLDEPLWDCGFLADGRILVRSMRKQEVYFLDDGRLSPLPLKGASRMVVSDDGKRVLIGKFQGDWQLLSLQGETLVPTWERTASVLQPVIGLAFSPDESLALVGTFGGKVSGWDLASGDLRYEYGDHQHAVFSAEISPDGRRIATASVDRAVRVHDLEQPEEALVLSAQEARMYFRVVWLDDRRLVTASPDAVRWWWLDAEGLREAARKVPIDRLTSLEENRFRPLLDR